MKLLPILFSFFFLLLSSNTLSQPFGSQRGKFTGGFGMNWIDGELNYKFRLTPELSFSKIGVGLDLNIDVNSKGQIRKENFNEFSDYLSIIRYISYGKKRDELYIKLGTLDYQTLGNGSIMLNYNNNPSYDVRKTGLILNSRFDKFGFESIYSNFAERGVVGLRAYTLPFQFTQLSSIPIIKNIETGLTVVSDFNEFSGVTSGNFVNNKFNKINDEGSITAIGIDLTIPLYENNFFKTSLYTDFTKILNFGSGLSSGLKFDFDGFDLITATAKIERRINGDNYIPSYFNSLYEIERFSIDTVNNKFSSKAAILKNMTGNKNGIYGELLFTFLHTFDILGSYQRLDATPNSGIFHLRSEFAPEGVPFLIRLGYDKTNIESESDLFKLDNRSYLFSEFGYKVYDYLLVSMFYEWTFTPIRDKDNNILSYEPQKRIEPRVSFIFPL